MIKHLREAYPAVQRDFGEYSNLRWVIPRVPEFQAVGDLTMRKCATGIAATILFAACAAPAAAAVQYDFAATSSYGGAYGSFSFVSPDFINSSSTNGTLIDLATLTSCSVSFGGAACGTQLLLNNDSAFTGSPSDAISFGTSNGASTDRGAVYYFADGALTNFGTFSSILLGSRQAATLRVSQAALSAVPEPATWVMMLIGFGGMGLALRRRRVVARLAV